MASLIGLYVVGIVGFAFLPLQGTQDWVVLALTAIACSLGAAFFGFLFGLPHSTISAQQTPNAILTPGTNLETVAQKVTELISGAALASLVAAAGYINRFGVHVQQGLTGQPAWGILVGDALLVFYGSLGFLLSYILTRTVGGFEFLKADQRLLDKGASTFYGSLPDLPPEPTPEQENLAREVSSMPFSSMHDEQQQLTWARAQAILQHYDLARTAYASLYANNPQDIDIAIEFATVLYNDSNFKNINFVLTLVDSAASLTGATDPDRRSRIEALRAAAYLYVSGGYVATIETVNKFITLKLPPTKTMHFYRACAFGQLYQAYSTRAQWTSPTGDGVSSRIMTDITVTLGFGQRYADEVILVSEDSSNRPLDQADDDDLQQFAADHPDYARMVGLAALPKPPDPQDAPPIIPIPNGVTPDTYATSCPA